MTTKRDELKNQVAASASSAGAVQEQKPRTPAQQVGDYLEKMMPSIQSVLPQHVTAERMSRIALNVIRTNPKLLQCNINSLMGGVMEAAKLGLEPGLQGQCYLIPFDKREKVGNAWKVVDTEAQFIIGYKGLIDLVRRSGQVSTIEARTVHENDAFDFEYGLEDKLYHKPTLTDKGAPIAYYAKARMKDGGYSFLVMGHQDMEAYKEKYAKSKKFGPWVDEFDAMARKSVLRQLIKYLPISVEQLSNFDEQSGADVHNEVNNARIDLGDYTPQNVDKETGELLNDGEGK